MLNKISEGLIGENSPKLKKINSSDKDGFSNEYIMECNSKIGPIYSDTDSAYFIMEDLVGDNVEDAILCADSIAGLVNDSFQDFMKEAFFCQPNFDNLIKANREVVATSGIFRAKKKYILLVADMEGTRLDPKNPKALKSQGSDIKISSTPETIRGMLKDVTMKILTGIPYKEITNDIMEFRRNINHNENIRPLDYASITSVKNIDEYFEKWRRIEQTGMGNAKLPGNVRASLNHNLSIKLFGCEDTQAIFSGMKIKIVWLKPNEHKFNSMAFASETEVLPKWFTDNFEIDIRLTETKLVDQKLKNIFEPIGWVVPTLHTETVNKLLSFD